MEKIKNFFAKFKITNKSALRHGSYATVIIAVVIVGVILVNMLMGVLNDRGLLSFDMTANKQNTLDPENLEYIKSIDKEITITMLSREDDYGSTLNNYASQYLNVVDDSGYFAQTVQILKQYQQRNRKIKVVFEDFYSQKTESYVEEFPNLFYGDIIVECEGKKRHIEFDDIYKKVDDTGYAEMGYSNYYVGANNIETAVSSAINSLVSGEVKKMALVSSHSNAQMFQYYQDSLKYNNFEITEIKDTILQTIPEDVDILVIAAPTNDLIESEVTVINQWLTGGEKLGKSFIFIPGNTLSNKPVLKQFLAEWGAKFQDGIVYQTDATQAYQNYTTMAMHVENNTISKEIAPSASGYSIVGSNLVLTQAYTSYGTRTSNIIVSTGDGATIAPEDASSDWKPDSNAKKQSYAGIIVTEEEKIVDGERYTSAVAIFSSPEFIYSSWVQYSSLQNLTVSVNTASYISGMSMDGKTFLSKTLVVDSFEVSEGAVKTIKVLFTRVVPILVVAIGVFVWIRRKRK